MELQELLSFHCSASVTAILLQDIEKWFSRNWSSSFLCCKGSCSFPGHLRASERWLLWACSIPGPSCPAGATPSRKSQLCCSCKWCPAVPEPITLALGNVSLVTWGIWNFQQLAAIRCNTAPLLSADGSVLCFQGSRRNLQWALTSLLGEKAF